MLTGIEMHSEHLNGKFSPIFGKQQMVGGNMISFPCRQELEITTCLLVRRCLEYAGSSAHSQLLVLILKIKTRCSRHTG